MRLASYAPLIVLVVAAPLWAAESWPPAVELLFRAVEVNVGESRNVTLSDGSTAAVKLVDVREIRDDLRQAVREARVTLEVNGQKATIVSANYRLPAALGDVQIDCPAASAAPNGGGWARLRLWPAGSPWIQPETFTYPAVQRWFAGSTQMANEPTYVDHGESPGNKSIYYHGPLDIGGAEGLVEVVAATDAVIVSAGLKTIEPPDFPSLVETRSDVIYLRDGRGWYYRYSHLHSFDPAIQPGARVKLGQKLGLLGKEGGSGGWSHLHFGIDGPQPNGKYGMIEGYAFIWQAYHAQRRTQLQAVARPHHVAWSGESVVLDGSRSWSAKGPRHIAAYQWILSDGTTSDGLTVTRRYDRSGQYSEILKVTDADGRVDYDFAVVEIFDREHAKLLPPTIHAVYWPTLDLKAGDEVTFKVRSFGIGRIEGHERWDFGDGSPPVEVQSDGNAHELAKDGYAVTKHRYAKPGVYLVSVFRTNDRGQTATARLHIHIE